MITRTCPLARPFVSGPWVIFARVHAAVRPVSATMFAHTRCAR